MDGQRIEPAFDEPVSTGLAPAPRHYRLSFTGSGSEYFRIWIVNLLLSIVTFGIYSAWAKVRTQRYFYAHTQLDGTGFEYSANPIAILKGRIVMVLAAAALYWASSNPLTLLAAYGVILLLTPFLVVLAMRFRLRNSSWRGVHFNFHGGFAAGALRFALLPLLGIVSLTLAMPWVVRMQQQFLAENSAFGRTRANAELPTWPYYKMYFGVLGLSILGVLLLMVMMAIFGAMAGPEAIQDPENAQWLTMALAGVFYLVLGPVMMAYSKSRMNNTLFNNSRLGDVQFSANQTATALTWIYASNIVLLIGTLGFAFPWAAVRLARYRAEHLSLQTSVGLDQFIAGVRDADNAIAEEVADGIDIDFGF